jgi:transcriptional regulator with XRE-family HTH domain
MSAFNLKSAREAVGLTQTELGERVGMPPSMISRYESGLRITTKARARLVRALREALPEAEGRLYDLRQELSA